jgi:putative tryptophan/tyrosine transport system substrate-binding protein
MKRREFMTLLGGAAAAWPFAARAQERARLRSIGVIMNYAEADPAGQTRLSALRSQLHKLGWIEENNIHLEARWPGGNADRMGADATEIISRPVEVIVANSTPLLETLKRLTTTIPIVFTQVADPVGSGFVHSFSQPGGNITGFSDFDKSMAGKWTELLKEAVPSVSRVTVLMDPNQSNHPGFLGVIESSAPLLKIQVFPAGVRDQAEIEVAIKALAGKADRALVVLPGPINNTLRHSIIELAERYRVPAVYPFKYYSKDGGLLYYGVDQVDQWPNAAGYVDRILRGEKPSELPIQAPTKFELVINLKTAKALGLAIPPSLLARADEVIE